MTNAQAAVALRLSNVAAGALATLAKRHTINQITISEEAGVRGLVELLNPRSRSTHENATRALWHLAATEENQAEITLRGGLAPLIVLLGDDNETAQQYAAAAVEALARDHAENQVALTRAGAIVPLVVLLGSHSVETQEHAVGALLFLASQDVGAVVEKIVAVLELRNAAAQMKAAEALAILARRSAENRKAITLANAVLPLVRLLGDGRGARTDTPQERAAAVLADLSRSGENKAAIVEAGGVLPLVAMLTDGSAEAQVGAAGALWHLAALEANKAVIHKAGAIAPLVALLGAEATEAQKFAAGALWHLASSADSKTQMAAVGAIPPLVTVLGSPSSEAREYASAVLSTLARGLPANKKAIYDAGGVAPLIKLLSDERLMSKKYAACALWGLAESDVEDISIAIVEEHGIPPLIEMLLADQTETRGFAAACLSSLCAQPEAQVLIKQSRGGEPLCHIARGPPTWLRARAVEMLQMLEIPVPDSDDNHVARSARGGITYSPRSGKPAMTFHFFGFQTQTSANWLREERAGAWL